MSSYSPRAFDLSPSGIVYSELDDNLISMQLSVPDGSVFQLANFFFDFDPNDADPSADANVILSAGLLDAGSGFLPAVAPTPVPLLPWTGRLALVLLLGGLVPLYVVGIFRTSNAFR